LQAEWYWQQILNKIKNQRSKIKMTNQNSKIENAIPFLVFLFFHFEGICLEIGDWNSANEIATPRQVGARNDTLFCHCEERSDEAISSTNYLP
jgi:hypothetical protein